MVRCDSRLAVSKGNGSAPTADGAFAGLLWISIGPGGESVHVLDAAGLVVFIVPGLIAFGVDFVTGCIYLPGSGTASPPFVTTAGFSADSDPPAQPSGVNPSEWVCIIFDLQLGRTYADVLSELADGTLRIGIHVQGFSSGGSESLINVPEPGTALLLALGLGGLAAGRRRALCA